MNEPEAEKKLSMIIFFRREQNTRWKWVFGVNNERMSRRSKGSLSSKPN